MPEIVGQTTCGNFKKETDAAKFFDDKVNEEFFILEREVSGRRLFDDKPVKTDGQNLRIDRMLYPTAITLKKGWKWGPIGVELKRSNEALGPIFTQIFEQRQSLFLSKYLGNARILPIIFSIFPAKEITHDLHSLSERQLILSCHYDETYKQLQFGTFSKTVLSIGKELWINGNWKPSTKKGHQGRQK